MPPSTPVDEGARREESELADQTDGVPSGDSAENGSSEHRRGRFPWLPIVLGLVGLLAVGAGLYAFLRSSGGAPQASPPPVPTRVAFAFPDPILTVRHFGAKPSASAAADVGEQIRTSLSALYDRGFVDPDTWAKGLPADIWSGFDQTAASRAQAEPGSLTLGREPTLEQLDVTTAKLRVTVLFDTQRHVQSAIASVVFQATGDLQDGSLLDVRSDAAFVFSPVSGRWVITGFPRAHVTVDSDLPVSPTPSPSISPGATP